MNRNAQRTFANKFLLTQCTNVVHLNYFLIHDLRIVSPHFSSFSEQVVTLMIRYSFESYNFRNLLHACICSRHVILPADLARHVPKTHLMSETEWRNLGVQQSPGWVHYMMHVPGINFNIQ